MTVPPQEYTEEWREPFTKILLEYLDSVNLRHAALYNRPVNEITYPEFHRFYDFISNLLAEKRKRVECAIEKTREDEMSAIVLEPNHPARIRKQEWNKAIDKALEIIRKEI